MNIEDAVSLVVILLLGLSVIIMAAPGFEAVFVIAGVLGIACLYYKKKGVKEEIILE